MPARAEDLQEGGHGVGENPKSHGVKVRAFSGFLFIFGVHYYFILIEKK